MDVYIEEEIETRIVYVNGHTRKLFKQMLNEIEKPIKFCGEQVKFGSSLFNLQPELFESMFNRWVTKCQEKGYMVIQNDNASERYLRWNSDLSDVQKALCGIEVLKEML
tara:strand:+ start:627 stop:953 length:327 start_codon:yes stop_codon:yes gene_type:complete